jgi:hypothetical protein
MKRCYDGVFFFTGFVNYFWSLGLEGRQSDDFHENPSTYFGRLSCLLGAF